MRPVKRMDWSKLLSKRRLRGSGETTSPKKRAPGERNDFEQDFDRIVYSEPFRRLQNKTQVHTQPNNDHVRNRLTHSIEVGTVARSLGLRIAEWLKSRKELSGDVDTREIADCVQAAAVAHDIGNPPFGHAGEEAIQHWFREEHNARSRNRKDTLDLNDAERKDFFRFDGNAQGLRLLVDYPQGFTEGGLELTCATLASFVKYPITSQSFPFPLDEEKEERGTDKPRYKKPGIFQEELKAFRAVATEVGLVQLSDDPPTWARHPLVFLVEAADDICYTTADIEDGVELRLIPISDACSLYEKFLADEDRTELKPAYSSLGRYRSQAIGGLIERATANFQQNYDAIMNGEQSKPLLDDNQKDFADMKKLANDLIFASVRKLRWEVAGREALNGLLKRFATILCEFKEYGWDRSKLWEKNRHKWRLLQLTDRDFAHGKRSQLFREEEASKLNDYTALLKIVDFVSGMTDRYAIELYRSLKGITL